MSSSRKAPKPNKDTALHRYLETQRGRAQYRPAPHISQITPRVLRPIGKKFGRAASVSPLRANWEQFIGHRFARHTQPLRFLTTRRGRTLLIFAPQAAHALISADARPILNRINAVMGDKTVMALKMTTEREQKQTGPQGGARTVGGAKNTQNAPKTTKPMRGLTPVQEETLQEGLGKMGNHQADDPLRKALEKMGRAVYSQNRQT